MVRIRDGKVLARKYMKGGISLLKFSPGIYSLVLDGNSNSGYLDVENMLSTHHSLK